MALSENVKIAINIEVTKSTQDIGKLESAMDDLSESLKKAEKGSKEYVDIQKALSDGTKKQNDLFVANSIATANAATKVGDLNKALKDLKSSQELVDKSSPKFGELQTAITDTEDKLGNMNDSFKTLTGSGVERFKSSLGLVKEGIGNLDFGKFATGIKGATKAFGGLKAALASLGIGLIIAAVSYLIENFDDLKNSSGILGKALSFIGDIISTIIDALKYLADALGIIDLAQEARVKAAEDGIVSEKKAQEATENRYDAEIGYAKAAGKNTFELEKKKQQAIQESLLAQAAGVKAVAELNGKFTDDQIKQYSELLTAVQKSKVAEKTLTIAHNKELTDDAKKKHDEDVKNYKEASAKKKKQLEEDVKKSEDLAKQQLDNLNKNHQLELVGVETNSQQYIDIKKRQNEEELKLQTEKANQLKISELDLKLFKAQAAQETIDLQKKFDEQVKADAQKKVDEEKERTLAIKENNKAVEEAANEQLIADLQAKADITMESSQAHFEAQQALVEAQRQIDLQNEQLSADQKVAINMAADEQLRQLELDRVAANTAIAADGLNAIQGLSDLFFSIKAANTAKDSKSAEANAKKQFQVNKALQLGGAVIDGAKAITASLALAPVAIGPLPNPAGIASLIAVATSTAATIAKIASTQYQSSGGGGGGSAPSVPSAGGGGGSSPAAPSQASFQAPTFFGLGQGGANTGSKPVVQSTVSVVEINDKQSSVAVSQERGVERL